MLCLGGGLYCVLKTPKTVPPLGQTTEITERWMRTDGGNPESNSGNHCGLWSFGTNLSVAFGEASKISKLGFHMVPVRECSSRLFTMYRNLLNLFEAYDSNVRIANGLSWPAANHMIST